MREALDLAKRAAAAGEVPVGAVLEYRGRVIATAHNLNDTSVCAPPAHSINVASLHLWLATHTH